MQRLFAALIRAVLAGTDAMIGFATGYPPEDGNETRERIGACVVVVALVVLLWLST